MKNHFYIPYYGNKRKECERIYNNLEHLTDEINIIVEPYCGTCAMSFYIWTKHKDKNYKFILNDNNTFLKEMYEIMRDKNAMELFNEIIDKQRNYIFFDTDDEDEQKRRYKEYLKENNVYTWFFSRKYYNIRPGMFPQRDKKAITNKSIDFKTFTIYEFYNNADIEFYTLPGINIYEQYKTRQDALILLDPPYLNSCNDYYQDAQTNIYEHLYNHDINNENAYIMLILENIWIIKLLFQHCTISEEYGKTYERTKRTTTHIMINNFYI
jgi:hypothetical protein